MKILFPYYNILNGLRGFAILLVLYAHSSLAVKIFSKLQVGNGAFLGVDVFFVLSSFLIGSLLLKEFLEFGNISLKYFYIRRLLRLSPPLFLSLVIFIPIIFFISWKEAIKNVLYTLSYSANLSFSFIRFIPPVFQPTYFAHTWSLATEEQFYLTFPFILLYILNTKKKLFTFKRLLLSILGTFSLAVLLRPFIHEGVYFFPLWRTGEFLLGILATLIYANIQWEDKLFDKASFLLLPKTTLGKVTMILSSSKLTLLSFFILFLLIIFTHSNSWFSIVISHPLCSILSVFLILQSTLFPNKLIELLFNWKPIVKAGYLSYGIYLYHYPILSIERWFFIQKFQIDKFLPFEHNLNSLISIILQDSIYILLTLTISIISYKLIEQPLLKYKSTFTRHLMSSHRTIFPK
jgi:peptidoglycan/LPS O-acetylase OafA/YrhL